MKTTSTKPAKSNKESSKTRMDPRQKRSRDAILHAGRTLFAEHHPANISTDEVIRKASVSKQTFYNHFPDKDELVREILRLIRARIDADVTQWNDGEHDPARRITNAVSIYAAQAVRNPKEGGLLSRLPLYIALNSTVNAPTIEDLKAGLREGRLAFFCLETGLGVLIGISQALLTRMHALEHISLAVPTCLQFNTLLLRAYGLAPLESELIATQAAERILRPVVDNL